MPKPLIEYPKRTAVDDQFRQALIRLRDEGEVKYPLNKPDRPPTYSQPTGVKMVFDLRKGFPLMGYRFLPTESIRALVVELLWFLSGSTQVEDLKSQGVHLWDAWDDKALQRRYGREDGDLGPIYGKQWRRWEGPNGEVVDQIARLVHLLRTDPDSKALYMSAWHASDLMEQDGTCKTRPVNCHTAVQLSHYAGWVDLYLNQRSGDAIIGVPFNIASYSLLLMMLCQVTGLRPRYFVHTITDFHYYEDQREYLDKLIRREPVPFSRAYLNPAIAEIDDFTEADVFIGDYVARPAIPKIPVAR